MHASLEISTYFSSVNIWRKFLKTKAEKLDRGKRVFSIMSVNYHCIWQGVILLIFNEISN